MRVLITGAAGFIGSHIAELLDRRGHETVLLDNLLPKAHGPQATVEELITLAHEGGAPDNVACVVADVVAL